MIKISTKVNWKMRADQAFGQSGQPWPNSFFYQQKLRHAPHLIQMEANVGR